MRIDRLIYRLIGIGIIIIIIISDDGDGRRIRVEVAGNGLAGHQPGSGVAPRVLLAESVQRTGAAVLGPPDDHVRAQQRLVRLFALRRRRLFRRRRRRMRRALQFNSIQFNSIQFNAIQFNSIQFNSIQSLIPILEIHQ